MTFAAFFCLTVHTHNKIRPNFSCMYSMLCCCVVFLFFYRTVVWFLFWRDVEKKRVMSIKTCRCCRRPSWRRESGSVKEPPSSPGATGASRGLPPSARRARQALPRAEEWWWARTWPSLFSSSRRLPNRMFSPRAR